MIELVLTILSVAVIAVSGWAIIYFIARIVTYFRIRSQLGDMPSFEEIAELYRKNNEIIGGGGEWQSSFVERRRSRSEMTQSSTDKEKST